MTISDNNVFDPPADDNADGENNEENKEETGGGEESGGGGETSGNDGEEGGGESGADGSETGGGGETGGGSGEAPPDLEEPAPSPDYASDILESLDAVIDRMGDSPDYDSLADSFRTLADVVAKQTEALSTLSAPSVPVSGYEDFSYPVHVEYRIFPTALGSETGVAFDYGSPEDFEDGYVYMMDSVANGSLSYFHIKYVTDSDGNTVFDGTVTPEGPEEPEEPDTFREDVLAALDAINDNLSTVSANDLEYREQTLELQEQYLELQRENVQLQYHFVACSLLIAFVLMITLGYTIAHGFLQRMKVG